MWDGGNNQSFVETRKSAACDAKWARTTNRSGGYRYAAASLRFGCSNYCYHHSVSSPGTIPNNTVVYTPMVAYAATPTRSCGIVSTSGPISIPISISNVITYQLPIHSHLCHCEPPQAAKQSPYRPGDCFATLAMTRVREFFIA